MKEDVTGSVAKLEEASQQRARHRREAHRLAVYAIDEWAVNYIDGQGKKIDALTRLELEHIKDAHANAGTVEDPPTPVGHVEGEPMFTPCHCSDCKERRAKGEVAELVEGLKKTVLFYSETYDAYDVAAALIKKYGADK